MYKQILFLFFLVFTAVEVNSQSKITLINGKEIERVKEYSVNSERLIYKILLDTSFINRKVKKFEKMTYRTTHIDEAEIRIKASLYRDSLDLIVKEKSLDKYKAFSITDGASEKIFYEPDVLNEDPTVDWVRDFIKGEQYAMKHQFEKFDSKTGDWKKRRFSNNEIGGVVVGGAGSILSFYGILVPALYATVSAQFPAKLPPAPDITPELRNSEAFNYGYSKKKNNQRIRKGFIASAVGLVAGFATFYAIENSK